MILVRPSHEILTEIDGHLILLNLELAGRTCYKTEEKINIGTAEKFIAKILESGHESVIEHENISVRIICDRGVTHEIVRHRLVAFSQESTRYCNYKGGVTFVIPPWIGLKIGEYQYLEERPDTWPWHEWVWFYAMQRAGANYIDLLRGNGSWESWTPQQARSVLPNSLKTEIVMTANIREWRHILKLRVSKAAHPQMREVMIPILEEFREKIPILFDDIDDKERT